MAFVRDVAWRVLVGERLEQKLAPPPPGLLDEAGAPALRLAGPGRAPGLAWQPGRLAHTPPLLGMADPGQRARILHAFANHELQALELFAWALLAFPRAPAAFRQGLLETLADEQDHMRLYLERLAAHGHAFGDFPLNGYFWGKLGHLATERDFVCCMCLTFEQRNLDHTLDFAAAAEGCGDAQTAAVLRRVHADEIRHVRFGLGWLARWKQPEESLHDAWRTTLRWPLRPELARGPRLHVASRRAAGLDEGFLDLLRHAEAADA